MLQGLSAGGALAAVGAGLLDLDKQRGVIANAVAPMLGTGLGGVVAGLMVQYLPAPTHLVYEVLGVVFVLQAIALVFIAETVVPRPGALASLLPTFGSAACGTRTAAGRHSSRDRVVGDGRVLCVPRTDAHSGAARARGSFVIGGLALFVMAGSGAAAVLVLQAREPQELLRIRRLSAPRRHCRSCSPRCRSDH